ncbi:MAG: tetratricopeptide repeat protein [Gammaproteobacteria bacterium]|nr:tetratricopeptide repeat protein [Gammaproteobacteria bacterium]
MSLVNEMLKDLEKHHQKEKIDYPQQGDGNGPPPLPPEPHRRHFIFYTIGIAMLVVVVLLVIMLFETEHHSAVTDQQSSQLSQTNHTATSATTTITEQDSDQSAANDNEQKPAASNETASAQTDQPTNEEKHNNTIHEERENNISATAAQSPQADNATTNSPTATTDRRIKIAEPTITKEQRLANQYNQAMENIHSGHDDRAIASLTDILNQSPDYKNARVTLAAVLIRHQQTARAETVLQAGLKQTPKDPDYAKLTAHILVQQGRTTQALQLLTYAKPKNIDANVNYFALMASLYMQEQDYRNAKNIYQRLVTQDPLNATWWAGLGIAADKLGLTVEAHNAFARANKIGDLSPALQSYIDKESSYL